jgi:hypothetical protein
MGGRRPGPQLRRRCRNRAAASKCVKAIREKSANRKHPPGAANHCQYPEEPENQNPPEKICSGRAGGVAGRDAVKIDGVSEPGEIIKLAPKRPLRGLASVVRRSGSRNALHPFQKCAIQTDNCASGKERTLVSPRLDLRGMPYDGPKAPAKISRRAILPA